MARKKRAKKPAKKTQSSSSSVKTRIDVAWRNLKLFFGLAVLSIILYSLSTNDLFVNFFGVLSIILGFLTVAFLISWIVLLLVKRRN